MNEEMKQLVETIKQAGYDVYMRDSDKDTWLYYTDGKNIAYAQIDRLEGITLTTAHIPSQTHGTGFGLGAPAVINKETLSAAFMFAPHWAHDAASVRKWKDWDHFQSRDMFSREYKKV